MNKKWQIYEANVEETNRIAEKYLEKISSPWLFKDMDKAVDILRIKISHESKIRIICDYDVDGITSITVLKSFLEDRGLHVDSYIPNRL